MRKGELGLQRAEKISELRTRFEYLLDIADKFSDCLKKLGYKNVGRPLAITNLISQMFFELPGCEFLPKDKYVTFVNTLLEIEKIEEEANKLCREIGNDFGNFSLFEFMVLAKDILEVATYDSLMCPDYPCTSELISSGGFSYYEADDTDYKNEIRIDTAEKCWDFLKQDYDELDD